MAKPRILLIDDHTDTADVLGRLFHRRGYPVRTAGSLASARQLCGHEQFDVLIVDIGLPDGDGRELLAELRAKSCVPGIVYSGYGMAEDVARTQEITPGVEHVTKPVEFEKLLAAVRRAWPEELADVGPWTEPLISASSPPIHFPRT